MQVTSVAITRVQQGRMRAFATVEFDDCFAVHGVRVIERDDQSMFVAMPSRPDRKGIFRDIAHPTSTAFRVAVEEAVLAEYAKQDQTAAD